MKSGGGSSFVSIGVTQGAAECISFEYLNTHAVQQQILHASCDVWPRWFIAKVFRKSPFIIDSPGKLSARALRRRPQSI
jgi:hypothetical protein